MRGMALDRLQRLTESRDFSEADPAFLGGEDEPDAEHLVEKLKLLRKDTDRLLAKMIQYAENEEWYRFAHGLFDLLRSLEGVFVHFGLVDDLQFIEKLKAHAMRQGHKYR